MIKVIHKNPGEMRSGVMYENVKEIPIHLKFVLFKVFEQKFEIIIFVNRLVEERCKK